MTRPPTRNTWTDTFYVAAMLAVVSFWVSVINWLAGDFEDARAFAVAFGAALIVALIAARLDHIDRKG